MTNKPMLSVDRELLEVYTGRKEGDWVEAGHELRALLDKSEFVDACPDAGLIPAELVALLRADLRNSIEAAKLWLASHANGEPVEEGHLGCVATAIEMLRLGDSRRDQLAVAFIDKPAAQHQVRPPSATHFKKSDKCPSTVGIQYYRHDGGSRWSYWPEGLNLWSSLACKPDDDIEPIICTHPAGCTSCSWCGFKAEQPAPVADHPQCEECKGWGYHENHHEGGGTECGECGGSGNATVAEAMVMPDRMKVEPFTTIDRGSKNYKAGYNAAISEVAKLNGLKT